MAEDERTIPYTAPAVASTDPVELEVANARKLILRALDSKIARQDDASALGSIRLALKLAKNILDHPDESKYLRVKASSQALQRSLIKVVGGQDLLLAMGFRTIVIDFEEHWAVEMSPLCLRVLETAVDGLTQYEGMVASRAEQSAKSRKEKISGANVHREQILAEIEADKAERRERSRLMARTVPAEVSQE